MRELHPVTKAARPEVGDRYTHPRVGAVLVVDVLYATEGDDVFFVPVAEPDAERKHGDPETMERNGWLLVEKGAGS